MNELIIELTEISPREFFGLENANIDLLKKYFPKLKIVARGNKIKAYGDEDVLEEFDRRITMLLEQYMKYNKIDENVIERVLLSRSKEDYETPEFNSKEVIVHGVSGKPVKAQTANQRKLVELMRKNDMVFAVGPAGTGKTYTGVALAVKAVCWLSRLVRWRSFLRAKGQSRWLLRSAQDFCTALPGNSRPPPRNPKGHWLVPPSTLVLFTIGRY